MLRVQPLVFSPSLQVQARTATANGTGVDCAGVDAPSLVVYFGTWTDGTHTYKLQESDDNSSFSDVAAGDLANSTLAAVSSGGANNNSVQFASYKGGKRYLRAVLTASGTTTGAVSGALICQGHRHAADG